VSIPVTVPSITEVFIMLLKDKIRSGKFVILEEFNPPKGADFSTFLYNANLVRDRVDALIVSEMSNAVMRASSLGGCAFLQKEGFETVLPVCARDRNSLALQADILSANALGINNIMAVPGDEIIYGDHPKARPVNDLDLIELLETIKILQEGKDRAGIDIKGAPGFLMGAYMNLSASGGLLEIELEQLQKKIELGVKFVVTNPVFDMQAFGQVIKRIDTGRVAIIPTVLLLKSAGMARYIERNIKSVSMPPGIIRDIQMASDKQQKCIELAAELIIQIKEAGLAGVRIDTSGWEDKMPRILDAVGL
jgi:methylenetetrahydrofolate reductase (NADPH)